MAKQSESVQWERVISSSFSALSGQVKGLEIGINDDGTIWEGPILVLGIQTEIVERYSRRRRREHDSGDPHFPPSARSLREQGYTFEDRTSVISYVVHDHEYGPVSERDTSLKASNVRWVFFPADAPVPSHLREDAIASLKGYHERQTANGQVV